MEMLTPRRPGRLLNPNPAQPLVEALRTGKHAAGLPGRAWRDTRAAVRDLAQGAAREQAQALAEAQAIDRQRADEQPIPISDAAAEARARFAYHQRARGLTEADLAERARHARKLHAAYLVGLVVVLACACAAAATGRPTAAALLGFASLIFVVRAAHEALHSLQLQQRALLPWREFASRRDALARFLNPWFKATS